jgi:hypothetical protein
MCICGRQWGEHERFPQSALHMPLAQAVPAHTSTSPTNMHEVQRLESAPAMNTATIDGFDINTDIDAPLSYKTTAAGRRAAISRHTNLAKSKKAVTFPKKSLTNVLMAGGGEKGKKAVSKTVVANAHGSESSNEKAHHMVVLPSAVRNYYNMKCKRELTYVTIVITRGVAYFRKWIQRIHRPTLRSPSGFREEASRQIVTLQKQDSRCRSYATYRIQYIH